MKAKIIGVITFLILIAIGFTYYQFNRSHIDVSKQKPAVSIDASQLFSEFSNNETEANKNYLGKIIEVKGKIYSIDEGDQDDYNILLMEDGEMFGISCNVSNNEVNETLKKGRIISIKGECSGMLSDVILIRGVITKN